MSSPRKHQNLWSGIPNAFHKHTAVRLEELQLRRSRQQHNSDKWATRFVAIRGAERDDGVYNARCQEAHTSYRKSYHKMGRVR